MPSGPVTDAGFVTHEQGFEAVEPGVSVLHDHAAAVEFKVKKGIVIHLTVRASPVASAVGLEVTLGTGLAQFLRVEGAIYVEEESIEGNICRFEQGTKLGKELAQVTAIVVVAHLQSGAG